MKKQNRYLSALLALVLLLFLFPAVLPGVEAAEIVDSGSCGADLTWQLDSDGKLTISGTGDMEDFIYDGTNDLGDVYISSPWYSVRSSIKAVVITEGVTGIGAYAFYSCGNLTDVVIPESVTSIGNYAFSCCTSLTGVIIPESVASIKRGAFDNCRGLTNVTISEGVTSIGDAAFHYCSSLTSVTVPQSVTDIGDGAFQRCTSLKEIIFRGISPPPSVQWYFIGHQQRPIIRRAIPG